MPKPIKYGEYEVLKAGLYPAVVESIDDDEGSYGPQLKWIFTLGGKAEGKQQFGWCSPVLTPKSKLTAWLAALAPSAQVGKGFELNVEDLVGRECQLVLGVKAGADGIERNTIDSMLPVEIEETAPAAGPAPTGLPPRQTVGAGSKIPF